MTINRYNHVSGVSFVERIRRLVYPDAYIPQDNRSAFDIIPGLEIIYKERALNVY